MNVDISYYSTKWTEVGFYPSLFATQTTFESVMTGGDKHYQSLDCLHLIIERSGDVVSYLFYSYHSEAGGWMFVNLHTNGYAFLSLGELACLVVSQMTVLSSIEFDSGNDRIAKVRLDSLTEELRIRLEDTSQFRVKPLAPTDYGYREGEPKSFTWEDSLANEISQSVDKGATYVRFDVALSGSPIKAKKRFDAKGCLKDVLSLLIFIFCVSVAKTCAHALFG